MLAEIALLAATCAPDIHLTTLKAVVKHESGGNQYAVGVNEGDRLQQQPTSQEEATRIVRSLIEKGIDFDAGLGQINVRNWGWLNLDPETVFDPCTNLRASQAVLQDCYGRATKEFAPGQPALMAALSCYNTGNFRNGIKNGYVQKVIAGAGITVPALDGNALKKVARPLANPVERKAKQPSASRPDAFAQPRPDAFSAPRPDAFAQSRPDPFQRSISSRGGVGSIRYLHRTQ